MNQRVVENLNEAIRIAMSADPSVVFLGEDVVDPYGGAFRASRGLSTAFPDRVLGTPISELGIFGFANGLALAGQKPIVEVMFGDFLFLACDQIINFAAKTPTMYGASHPFDLLVRCPVGGHRGYGATHSQTIQKHFIGVPNLSLYELSPLHDNRLWLPRLLRQGHPSILFENKSLYAHQQAADGRVDDLFQYDFLDAEGLFARTCIEPGTKNIPLFLTSGGMFPHCLAAARRLLLEHDLETHIITPFQLYPFRSDLLRDTLDGYQSIYIVEESTPGGTWGQEVWTSLIQAAPGRPLPSLHLLQSRDSIIPAARHLEKEMLLQSDSILRHVLQDLHHAPHRHPSHQ